MSACVQCNKKTRSTDCINCDICKKPIHVECSGLSRLEVECIRSSTRKIHYYCEKCDIVAAFNALQTELNEVKSELNVLTTELNLLKTKQDAAANDNLENVNHKNLKTEEIIAEAQERYYRSHNLILSNLPETTDNIGDHIKSAILSKVNDANISLVSCTRLGKFNDTKTRPVKLTFSSPQDALTVLKHYVRSGNLYLNRDLTRLQQNQSYVIRTEYRSRKGKGENITLRYTNGIPRIVELDCTKNA